LSSAFVSGTEEKVAAVRLPHLRLRLIWQFVSFVSLREQVTATQEDERQNEAGVWRMRITGTYLIIMTK